MKTAALAAALLAMAALPGASQVVVNTGFEAPDYVLGDITGQQGWVTNSTNYTVTGLQDFVISGSQSLLVTGNAGRYGSIPIPVADNLMSIEVKMAKAMVNSAQWWVGLQQAGNQGRSAVFGFNAGGIQYYRSDLGWVNYSSFNAGQVYTFAATVDIAAKTWSFFVDGTLAAKDIPTFSTTPLVPTEVYFYRGFLSLSGLPSFANYAVADDLVVTVVPEPASLVALAVGLAGFAGIGRKRSQA